MHFMLHECMLEVERRECQKIIRQVSAQISHSDCLYITRVTDNVAVL